MSTPMSKRQTKRSQQSATLVAVWVPTDLLEKLDSLARVKDSDRSKIIRSAIRKATA
jgi:metal-responsive CopG/Arc/MetJ family transcriptional regulator